MFDPKYSISPAILNNITKIEKLKSELEKAKLLPKQELSFKKRAAIRMAQSSTSIEGNSLNAGEVEKVFLGKPPLPLSKDEQEVKNYQKAIAFVGKESQDNQGFNTNIILKAHGILMETLLPSEKRGNFRKGPVYVVNAFPSHDEVVYAAPKAPLVPNLIKDLANWIADAQKKGISPIIQAGFAHHELAAIHPFSDGNGRLARLLTIYLLYARKYEIKKIYSLDTFYNQDRKKYYQEIYAGRNYRQSIKYDLTGWLEYFTQGFVWELSRIKDQIGAIKVAGNIKDTLLLEKGLLRILDFAATLGKVTSADVEEMLGVSKRSAQLRIKKLTTLKLLKKDGKGPRTCYITT